MVLLDLADRQVQPALMVQLVLAALYFPLVPAVRGAQDWPRQVPDPLLVQLVL